MALFRKMEATPHLFVIKFDISNPWRGNQNDKKVRGGKSRQLEAGDGA